MDYTIKAKQVAKDLIGRTMDVGTVAAEIVETEAYEGGNQTARRHCMMLAPGQIGVMPYRGLHFLNIGTASAGTPSCVLVRAVEINGELVEGPGRVGKALNAPTLEYKMMEKDITLRGETKPSELIKPADASDNSLGRYRRT